MKRIFIIISCSLLLLFISTNSYNQTGLEHYYFVIAIGLDKSENDLLKFTVQLSTSKDESSSSGSSQANKFEIFSVEAKTINEAITILNNYLNKKLNLSHCSAIVISEELARNGIENYLNSLSNNTELRHSALLLISSTSSYELIKNIGNSGEAFTSRLYDHFSNSLNYTGFSYKSTFGSFFEAINNNSRDPLALYVLQKEKVNQTSGFGIFEDDKLIEIASIKDSISHLILTNNLKNSTIRLSSPYKDNEFIDVELSLYKNSSLDIEIINNVPCITANIYPEGKVLSSGSTFNYTHNELNKTIENLTNEYISASLKNYFYNVVNKLNCDTIGIEERYKSKLLTENEFDKTNWDNTFQKSLFTSKIKTKINSSNLLNHE